MRLPRISTGLLYMALSALAFSIMAAFVRVVGQNIPTMELVVFRSLFIIVVSLPFMVAQRVPVLGRHRFPLFLRGFIGFFAMSGFYWTLTKMPVADAVTVQYTSPVFTTLFAAMFLKERAGSQLWTVIGLCMLGVVMIVKPGFGGDPIVGLVGLGAAAAAGAAYTVVRSLGGRENALTIIFYFPLVSLPMGLVAAAPQWVWPTPWVWLAVVAACLPSYLGQIWLTKGLEREPAGRGSTVTYLSIGFGAVIGWAFLDQRPDPWSVAGIAVIVLALTLLNERVEVGARWIAGEIRRGVENGYHILFESRS